MNEIFEFLNDNYTKFNLPKPETNYQLIKNEFEEFLILAWPKYKIGINKGINTQIQIINDWKIIECFNYETAQLALNKVAEIIAVESNSNSLDFKNIQSLFDAGQYESARFELDKLLKQIQPDHTDYITCQQWIKEIRKAAKQKSKISSEIIHIPRISFPLQIKNDAETNVSKIDKSFNILGIYAPRGEIIDSIDALWLGSIRNGSVSDFTACIDSSSAYSDDPNWEIYSSELALLETLLEKLDKKPTFIWGAEKLIALINNWHYRLKGAALDSVSFYDLEKIANVFFPMVHRTDSPESFCKQLKIDYTDEMGLGGPLAASLGIINNFIENTEKLPKELRAVIKIILSKGSDKKTDRKLFVDNNDFLGSDYLSKDWLDILFPSEDQIEIDAYKKILKKWHNEAPSVSIISKMDSVETKKDLCSLDFLKENGIISEVSKFNYTERKEQIAFSEKIEECHRSDKLFVLEAGTGIGKTIGYLIPSLLSGNRTYISTHTKSLQDQAWYKDIPIVFEALSKAGVKRKATIIKGKSNYVCLQTVADILDSLDDYIENVSDGLYFASILHWLLVTKTGWLSEVEHLKNDNLSKLITRETASPVLSPEWSDIDPYNKAKIAVSKADLIITNHSYVILASQLSEQENNNVDAIIVDEAHNLESAVSEVLTLHFEPFAMLTELKSFIKRDKSNKIQGLFRAITENKESSTNKYLRDFSKSLIEYENSIQNWCNSALKRLNNLVQNLNEIDPDYPISFEIDDFWIPSLYDSAKILSNCITNISNNTHQIIEAFPSIKRLPGRLQAYLGSFEQHLNENNNALRNLFEKKNDWVNWGEVFHSNKGDQEISTGWILKIHCSPINVSAWLSENFYPKFKHKAFVSATLTDRGSFDPIFNRLGIDHIDNNISPVTGIYPSPFNYKKQALVAIPHDMPITDPTLKIDPYFIEEQSKQIAKQAIISEGRMLVLFTSKLIMSEIELRLQVRLKEHDIVVISQNSANKSALIDRLREAPVKGERIVLLGIRSFWEGVDIPGSALTTLVITRLPFDNHNHPVQRARKMFYEASGHDRDYFREYIIPSTFIHLRQMYGRLIRTEKDRGVIVITDPRIYSKKYGKSLLHSLPESTIVVDNNELVLESVKKFLDGENIKSAYSSANISQVPDQLSLEQKAIIESPSKRMLVRATAGSGKTHVLITRLIRLVENLNAKPDEILALTFTNKAMNLMYNRIENALGSDKAYLMYRNILTYHKLAMRIIRQDDLEKEKETGFIDEKNPALQQEFISIARQKADIHEQILNFEDALALISYAQNSLINEEDLKVKIPILEKQSPLMAKFAVFYISYINLLRENKLIDYGEAIVQAIRILRNNKDQAQRWTNRFRWIFCDEYQDTSPAQATLLQLLGQQANLFVVGDAYQSIYSWQGSNPDNLNRFELDFPNTSSYYLSKNFRCFPNLVRMSMSFLEKAGELKGERIEYDYKRSVEDQNVYFLNNVNDEHEATNVSTLIKKALKIELPGKEARKATVGVLARKWFLLESIEKELIKQEIPYKFEGESAKGILASPKIKKIVEQAAQILLKTESENNYINVVEGEIIDKLKRNELTFAADLLKELFNHLNAEKFSTNEKKEFNQLCDFLADQKISILKQFNSNNRDQSVVLSTIHSQKGEEFDTVILIGMEEGNMPHEQPKSHDHLLEWRKMVQLLGHAIWRERSVDKNLEKIYNQEEKRIFYVAITRAKYNLVVSNCENRNIKGYLKRFEKSSFRDLSYNSGFVKEVNSQNEVEIKAPKIEISNKGSYKSDGRVFETVTGVHVRSKSELLLANEFTRNGIYYEYEQSTENVLNALPDFTLPDYGNVIIEHLGLLNDALYLSKWEEKAKKYEAEGLLYLRTNEEEILKLTQTVKRLKLQSRIWCAKRYGYKRLELVEKIEEIRRVKDLKIEKPVGSFEDGIFEVDDNNIKYIAISDDINNTSLNQFENIIWEPETLNQFDFFYGKIC